MYRFTTADVAYLRSTAGTEALTALANRPLTDRLADVTAARQLAGDRFAAALETAVLRKKATAKLADPTNWLFCDAALQQATATAVAQHRATRLQGRDVHDVTCGIGAILTVAVFMLIGVYATVLQIIAAIKANQGEYFRYPFIWRIVT